VGLVAEEANGLWAFLLMTQYREELGGKEVSQRILAGNGCKNEFR
jgi:hypothetical protein